MIYECFFESVLWQVKTGLENQNRRRSLLMEIGANALNQAMGTSCYNNSFRLDLDLETETDANWLIYYLHDYLITQTGRKPLEKHMRHLARMAWNETDKKGAEFFLILPFLAYYETRWNERKGYGELAVLAGETKDGQTPSGSRMTAMIQCYGEMTEEAFDQREVFADLFRSYAKSFQEHWNPQAFNCSLDSIKAAYALLKGIRLGVLQHESYKDIAEMILVYMELNGFICEGGRVRLKEESPGLRTQAWKGEDETSDEKAMYCMMAYGEYRMLGKERPYYGVSNYF